MVKKAMLPSSQQNAKKQSAERKPAASKNVRNELKAVSRWFRDLPDEKRTAIRRLHQIRPAYNAIAFLFVALWGLEAYLMHRFPYMPVRLAGYVLIGFHIHGLANLMHEAVHGNFFRNRTVDRWCGFVLGAPALVSGTAFRVVHLQHHQYNRSEADPDEISSAVPNARLRQVAFYGHVLLRSRPASHSSLAARELAGATTDGR
jgi:fatty acid desaturase